MSFRNHIVTHEFPGVEMVNTQGQTQNISLTLVIDTLTQETSLHWRIGRSTRSIKVDNPVAECLFKAWRGGSLDSKRSRRFVP